MQRVVQKAQVQKAPHCKLTAAESGKKVPTSQLPVSGRMAQWIGPDNDLARAQVRTPDRSYRFCSYQKFEF